MFERQFHDNINQLLQKFPPDHRTETGEHFWNGTKRCPHALKFDQSDTIHLDFIVAAANLLAYIYSIPQMRDRNCIAHGVTERDIDIVIHNNGDQEMHDIEQQNIPLDPEQVLTQLLDLRDPSLRQLRPHQFEKDDDTNFHIDYIAATANLRAKNYEIEIAERSEIKRIAGNIIPAMATTTAMITGFVCLEVYKLLQGHQKIESYRNTFINLCLPRFCLSEPRPADKKQVKVI